jgi:hypothetical protein
MAEAGEKKPWFKKKRIIIPAVLVILGIAFSGSGSDSGTSEESGSSEVTQEQSEETKAGIGTEVRDGKFAFVVNEVKCGISKVGSSTFNAEAQGQFCKVSMTVSNIGDEPQTFFGSNQKAFDSAGREFTNDTAADLYDSDSQTWLKDINPGNSLTGNVYFDIPKDASLEYLELHDSAFSSGVKVFIN